MVLERKTWGRMAEDIFKLSCLSVFLVSACMYHEGIGVMRMEHRNIEQRIWRFLCCQAKRRQRQAGICPTINVSAAAVWGYSIESLQLVLPFALAILLPHAVSVFAAYLLLSGRGNVQAATRSFKRGGRTKKPHVHCWKGWTHVAHSHARNLFLFSWSSKHCRQLSDCKNTAKPWWVPWPSPLK